MFRTKSIASLMVGIVVFIFLPSLVFAIPVTFSFTNYSGPARGYYDYTVSTNGVVTESGTLPMYDGLVNGQTITVDESINAAHVGTDSYSYTNTNNEHIEVILESYNEFGQVNIDPNVNPLSFQPDYDPDFGEMPSNMFRFDPVDNTEVDIGVPVFLGTFTFTNEIWFTSPALFDFTITASSELAELFDQEFSDTIELHTKSDQFETPEERADWFYIVGRPELGSVRVFDSDDGENTGSVDFWGIFGSLDLVEFRNPTGGAFLNASTNSDLAQVPEPSTMLLLGVGLVCIVVTNRKRL